MYKETARIHRALKRLHQDGLPRDTDVKPTFYKTKANLIKSASSQDSRQIRVQIFGDIAP